MTSENEELGPTDGQARLQALRSSGLLDSPPEIAFDRLTELICRLLEVPISLVVLPDVDRQFFKSVRGLVEPWTNARETPLSHSFCQHVVASAEPLVIEDARLHPLVRNNPAIRDFGVVAYLGMPLFTPDGHAVATLCAIDHQPRRWTPDNIKTVSQIAELAMTEIALKFRIKERDQANAALQTLNQELELLVQERTAELKALSERYRHDALHDALTGLPNRAHFQQRLRQAVMHNRSFAVLYLDFDHFKGVNDSYGHAVGDALLVAIGARLKKCMRPGELMARLGGDEFAVLMEEVGEPEDAVMVAERFLKAFQAPIQTGTQLLYCPTSIGMVMGDGGRASAENVLRDADIAMYRAKALGKAQCVVFEPSMREDIQTRLALASELRGAVEREELVVYYQPVLHSTSGELAGFEALVRWQHPERVLVPPADFIPLAEETGLIIEIDRWVLKTACAQLKAWLLRNPELTLSVNLSSRQFARIDLAPFIEKVLTELQLEAHQLKLELTESLLMNTSLVVRETLASLRDLGVRLHIDDFGIGYSSLAYLQRFDADALKVDRSFIMRMLDNENSAELVRTIVNMAHNLGLNVIAEGVETNEQYAQLRALGCEYVQGYLFSKPVPAAAAGL